MPIGAQHTPGIYVVEIPAGPQPIEAVPTSTAAFIGEAPQADAYVNHPRAVNNWSEFLATFTPERDRSSTVLSNAVWGFFQNGGGRCYIVNTAGGVSLTDALAALATEDEVAIVVAPGMTDLASYDALLTHCERLKDRVAILDSPEEVADFDLLTQVGTVEAGSAKPKRGAAADGGPDPGGLRPRQSDLGFGAFYFPWITVMDPFASTLIDVPPSGHVAGIWAQTDMTRGVQKAPANTAVAGALNVKYRITSEAQGPLNDAGVNCLRLFAREGIRVWGARTLAPAASEWRYVNVRRLFNMVEESIAEGTNWIVFEPNDRTLWKHVRRDVGAFLTRVWRDGALMGATPEQAFFVKCDEETNPPDVVDAGQVVAIIGLAPVKPAEFVVFQVMQSAAGAEVASVGGGA